MRVFFAIFPPAEIQLEVSEIINNLQKNFPEIKWIKNYSNLHLTLRFLGEVKENKVRQIKRNMLNYFSNINFKKFNVSLSGFKFLPEKGPPKVLYLRIKEGAENLRQLKINLDNGLSKVKFAAENNQKFISHLTLARIKTKINLIALQEKLQNFNKKQFNFQVSSFSLVQSVLTVQGANYTKLQEFNLGKNMKGN